MSTRRLVARDARDHPAQPRARRAGLPAGVARRAVPATSLFPLRGREADRRRAWRAASRRPGTRPRAAEGIGVKTMPDMRWARCDIKTVMLLPASLAKEAARGEGAPRKPGSSTTTGYVTEGASSNAWIVDRQGPAHHPRQIDNAILRGITRTTLIDLLRRGGDRAGRAGVHRGGSQGRARGVHHLGNQLRHAGGAHRRASRSATAPRGCCRSSCGRNFIPRPNSRTLMRDDLPKGSLPLASVQPDLLVRDLQ